MEHSKRETTVAAAAMDKDQRKILWQSWEEPGMAPAPAWACFIKACHGQLAGWVPGAQRKGLASRKLGGPEAVSLAGPEGSEQAKVLVEEAW